MISISTKCRWSSWSRTLALPVPTSVRPRCTRRLKRRRSAIHSRWKIGRRPISEFVSWILKPAPFFRASCIWTSTRECIQGTGLKIITIVFGLHFLSGKHQKRVSFISRSPPDRFLIPELPRITLSFAASIIIRFALNLWRICLGHSFYQCSKQGLERH